MENYQVITIIFSILIPFLTVSGIGFTYLIKLSKDMGIIEGFLFKELKEKRGKK